MLKAMQLVDPLPKTGLLNILKAGIDWGSGIVGIGFESKILIKILSSTRKMALLVKFMPCKPEDLGWKSLAPT